MTLRSLMADDKVSEMTADGERYELSPDHIVRVGLNYKFSN